MKESLHFSAYRNIGDWFLLEEHTIIRVYGFSHELYILPTFLTPRIFSLELVRQKLIVENEIFIRFRIYFILRYFQIFTNYQVISEQKNITLSYCNHYRIQVNEEHQKGISISHDFNLLVCVKLFKTSSPRVIGQ